MKKGRAGERSLSGSCRLEVTKLVSNGNAYGKKMTEGQPLL